MRWCVDNKWDDYDIDSYSTQNSNYSSDNTQNQILTTSWRTTTVATAATIVIDAGSGNTITADACVISGHNLTSGATIKIEGNATDAWGAPTVDETITYRSDHAVKFFTSSAQRFWRVYVLDTTNTDDYIEIGRIFLGVYLDIDPSSLINFRVTNERNDLVTETDQFVTYSTPGLKRRRFSYQFPTTEWVMTQSLRTAFETVGRHKPLYLFNLNTNWTYHAPAYARFASDFVENWIGNKRITWSVDLVECN